MADDGSPVWVTADEVEIINREVVSATSEPCLVLSRAALEAAVARPINAWAYAGERDRIVLAVRLLEGIGQGHCFQQGNKRTAFVAAIDFLDRNGGAYRARDDEALGRLVEGVILRTSDARELVAALRPDPMPR